MSSPTQDLEAYAQRYSSRGKILRLRFVAWRSPALAVDALRLAIDAAKQGSDTCIYRDLVGQAGGRLGSDYAEDELWIATTEKAATADLERLRQDLDDARTHQHNKEVIRASLCDLSDFFYSRGKLAQARGESITMRDYCTETKHHVSMAMRVVKICMEAAEYHYVENYVHIAENVPDTATLCPLELSFMRCCAGVAHLSRGAYKDAADRFLSNPIDTSEDGAAAAAEVFSNPFCMEDVATYAGLCALATLDRRALQEDALGNADFRALLELVPDVRELLTDFCATRYTSCLGVLEKLRPDLLLDPYLGQDDHVEKLYGMIRSKALVQYVQPFETVDLVRMAAAFKTELGALESELLVLIEKGSVKARIDSQHHSLHRKSRNLRREALTKAVATGEATFDDAEAMLLRMSLTKNGLSVSWPHQQSSLGRSPAAFGHRLS